MVLSAVSVLVVVQSSLEIPEGLMNNPVYTCILLHVVGSYQYTTVDLLMWNVIQETKMSGSEKIMILVSVQFIVKNKEIPHLNFTVGNNVPIGCVVHQSIV